MEIEDGFEYCSISWHPSHITGKAQAVFRFLTGTHTITHECVGTWDESSAWFDKWMKTLDIEQAWERDSGWISRGGYGQCFKRRYYERPWLTDEVIKKLNAVNPA